jgi:putrescine transport system permease protein
MAELAGRGLDRADAVTKMKRPQEGSFAQKLVVRIPFAWLLAFFLVPFLIVLKISLSQSAIARPPYTPVLDLAAGWHGVGAFFAALSLDNYILIGSDPLYLLS